MLEDLRAFVAVVDNTSLTKAADALSLTQSAVSRRVQQLEEALGATLLDRSTKPPTSTALGRRIYQLALPLLRDFYRLKNIPKEGAEPEGTFRLGMTQVVADVALFDTVIRMKAEFPKLDLICRTAWSSILQRQIESGEFDAVVLMLPSEPKWAEGAHVSLIARLDVMVVQSKQRPLLPARATVEDLAWQEWVLNPEGCGYRAALQRAIEGTGGNLRLGVDTHGTLTQLRLVAAGVGLGLAPRSLLKNTDLSSELMIVDVRDLSLVFEIWLIRPVEVGNLRQASDMLIRVLRQAFPQSDSSEGLR